MQEWRDIPDFPGYGVNPQGQVASHKTGHILSTTPNQQGIPQAGLFKEGRLYRKSVAVLVAEAFLEPHTRPNFRTPIHLDGDRSNCNVDNLMWRPRWFAIKYHRQFLETRTEIFTVPIHVLTTDEYFKENIECCVKYGLLANEVYIAAHNATKVFPMWYEVRIWET